MPLVKIGRLAVPCLMLSLSLSANVACLGDGCSVKMSRANSSKASEFEWKKINWHTSAIAALNQAQRENKPIFVLFLVNEKKYLAKEVGQT